MTRRLPHICWIHGWGMNNQVWRDVISHFPHAVHVQVDFLDCVTIDDYRYEVQQALRSNEGPWIIVGWSLGGMLALEHVFAMESNIQMVVLLSTTLKFEDADRRKGWPARVIERMRKQLVSQPDVTLYQFCDMMFSDAESNQLADIQVETYLTPVFQGLDEGLAYLMHADLTASWRAWRTSPTTTDGHAKPAIYWIHGSADQICPVGALPDDLQEDEFTIMVDGGHALMLTQREQLVHLVERKIYVDQ